MGRDALLTTVSGDKGHGKSYDTFKELLDYLRGYEKGATPRKVLIFDPQDEYGDFEYNGKIYKIKSISPTDVELFSVHPTIEMRRIRPFHEENGNRMTPDELLVCLKGILLDWRCGALLIEDIKKFTGKALPKDISGLVASCRHVELDTIVQYQSISDILPDIWRNNERHRYHHQSDEVEQNKDKNITHFQMYKITECLVNTEYDKGNKYFNVWLENTTHKIRGNYTAGMLREAIREYLSENNSVLRPLLRKRNSIGGLVYTYPEAEKAMTKKLFERYW